MSYFYYNKQGIGDTLLIQNTPGKILTHIKEGKHVTALFHDEEIIGYNLMNISQFLEIDPQVHGRWFRLGEDKINTINLLLSQEGYPLVKEEGESPFLVGLILSCHSHPDSNHLFICQVDVGNEVLQIVCGASNVSAGIRVVVAPLGTLMVDGSLILPSSIRGVDSQGMICSRYELGLTLDPTKRGIHILEEPLSIGSHFTCHL